MNLIEKILARASGKPAVAPGDVVVAEVDTVIFHDLSLYLTGRTFEQEVKGQRILHPERVVIVFDHFFAPATEEGARILQANREFARRHGLPHLFDSGTGNCHYTAIQHGFIRPGTVVVGSDSHTPVHGGLGAFATGIGNNSIAALTLPYGTAWFRVPPTIKLLLQGSLARGVTARDVAQYLVGRLGEDWAGYKAIEYAGDLLPRLDVEERLLFPLMCIDMDAKAGYIEPDEAVAAYIRQRTAQSFELVRNDPDAVYESVQAFDVGEVEPQVACPPTVGHVKPVTAVAGEPIQYAEVGGTPGGRLGDLRRLARVLDGRRVHPEVRLQVVPVTREVFRQALDEGIIAVLHDAGANIFPASSGSNQSTNMGALTAGQAMISTHTRNFPGRNGSPEARIFLASTYTVAASALKGRIADPREFLE